MTAATPTSRPADRAYERGKRALDVGVSVLGLAVLSPVLLGVALAVKLDSRGPVFYGHERLGRGWRPIRVWKFRTMVDGADRRGPAVTAGGDVRVTRMGRFLRATKLDELPQLWNVALGEMSLVGPRPEARRYADHYRDAYDRILQVRPGLTDYASVVYRREEQLLAGAEEPERAYLEQILPEKIELTLRYLSERSLRTDLAVLARTVAGVLFR